MLNRHPRLACYEEVQSVQWDSIRTCGLVGESCSVYIPRHAEESILYSVVSENLETFLAMQPRTSQIVARLQF